MWCDLYVITVLIHVFFSFTLPAAVSPLFATIFNLQASQRQRLHKVTNQSLRFPNLWVCIMGRALVRQFSIANRCYLCKTTLRQLVLTMRRGKVNAFMRFINI